MSATGAAKKPRQAAPLEWFAEDELDDLFNIAFPPPNVQHSSVDGIPQQGDGLLVTFLDACLSNLGWSRDVLAETMATDVQLIDAIMDRTLPESAIDEELLADLAHAIGYDPGILKLMVQYSKTPQADLEVLVDKLIDFAIDGTDAVETLEAFSAQAQELDTLQQGLANLLLQVFGGYYSAEVADDRKQRILYQAVIKKIKAVIASYQSDLEEARALLGSIRENYQAEINSIQAMVDDMRRDQVFKAFMDLDVIDREGLRAAIMERIENI